MGKTVGRLRAILGLDNSEFRQGLRQSKGELDRFSGGLAQSAMRIRSALGFTIAGVGIQQLVSRTRQAVRAVADLGDQAKRAGTSVETFQRWGAVAEQNRIGIDQMADGLRELQIRTDEFVTTGGGAAAEAFRRLGFNADQLKDKLKDPSELMLEIIGRLQGMDRAAQIRVADEVFGGSAGERFVELLARGEAGIRRTMQETRVLTDEQVKQAEELDRKYTALANNIATAWRGAAVAVSEAITGIGDAGAAATALEQSGLFKTDKQAQAMLGSELAEYMNNVPFWIEQHREAILKIRGHYDFLGPTAGQLEQISAMSRSLGDVADDSAKGAEVARAAFGALHEGLVDLRTAWDAGLLGPGEYEKKLNELKDAAIAALRQVEGLDEVRFSSVIKYLGDMASAVAGVGAAAEATRSRLRAMIPFDNRAADIAENKLAQDLGYQGLVSVTDLDKNPDPSVARPRRAPNFTHELGGGSGGGGGGGSAEKIEGYAKILADTRAEIVRLTAEAAELLAVANSGTEVGNSFEYARRRAELLAGAMEDGLQVTPQLRAEIDQLALSYADASAAAEEAAERLKEIEAAAERGEDAFESLFGSILEGSESAKRALVDLLMQMAKVQFSKGMLGILGSTSWGAKLIEGAGAMLGSNANGTSNWRGGLTALHERGSEIVDLPKGSRVIPHDLSKRMVDRSGGASVVEVKPSPLFETMVTRVARGEAVRAARAETGSLRSQIPVLMADHQKRRG